MATFRADKRWHFSEDGTNPWALFERVPGSEPAVYEFETSDAAVARRLEAVDEITRVEEKPVRKSRSKAEPEGAEPDAD